MIPFLAQFVCQIYSSMGTTICGLREGPLRHQDIGDEMKVAYSRLDCLLAIETHKDVLNDDALQLRAWGLRQSLAGRDHFTGEMLAREMEGLFLQIMVCLNRHRYAFIPSPQVIYFEQDQLFGGVVYELFPEARNDIKDAGNCLAADLNTAAVFHLMRAAEFGLRALARKVRVKLTHKGKPQPIDTAVWEKVINAIKSKLNTAHALKHGPKRSEQIKFYSDLADRCSFVKDLYRNDVSHTRLRYGPHDALAAYERVRGFMQLLCQI